MGGPRCSHSRSPSTAAPVPWATTCTDPSARLRAKPRISRRSASRRVLCLKYTPCTLPVIRKRRLTRSNGAPGFEAKDRLAAHRRRYWGTGASACAFSARCASCRAVAAWRLACCAAKRARTYSCASRCLSARTIAACAAYRSGEVVSVAPAVRAAAIACRASLISCTGGPVPQPVRQATPKNTAMRRNMTVTDTNNSRQGRQTTAVIQYLL